MGQLELILEKQKQTKEREREIERGKKISDNNSKNIKYSEWIMNKINKSH